MSVTENRRRPLVVSPAEANKRGCAYEELATARNLELLYEGRVDAHGMHFRGVHRGRETLLTTGILGDDPPSWPELQVWTNAVAVAVPVLFTHDSSPPEASGPRALAALLELEGVHNVGVTNRFVRVRFEAFVAPELLEQGWQALEATLAEIEREVIGEGMPYRG